MLLIKIKACDIETTRRQQADESDVAIIHLILQSDGRTIRAAADYYRRHLAESARLLAIFGGSQEDFALLDAARAHIEQALCEASAASQAIAALEVAA